MANVTSDFDVVVQISEELLKRILILTYFRKPQIQKINQPFNIPGEIDTTVDFNILIPSLTLHIERPQTTNTLIRIILPFTGSLQIRNFPSNPSLQKKWWLAGNLYIDTPLTMQSGSILIDFSVLQLNQLSAEISTAGIPAAERDSLEELIKLGGWSAVRSLGQIEALSLPLSGANSIEVLTQNSSMASAPACLAFFVMTLPGAVSPGLPDTFENVLGIGNDYAVAVSKQLFEFSRDAAIKKKFNNNELPATLPSDSSVTVNTLDMELDDGHINVKGTLTKDVSPGISADIDFSAPMTLTPDGVPVLGNVDADLPWWLDALNAIIPLIGSYIWDVSLITVENMVGESFGDLGSFFPFDFSKLGIGGRFPIKSDNKDIDIRTDGLVINGNIYIYTYVGNRRSKEIHVFNDSQWLDKMNDKYAVYYERYEDYLAKGYNGCAYCLSELNTG